MYKSYVTQPLTNLWIWKVFLMKTFEAQMFISKSIWNSFEVQSYHNTTLWMTFEHQNINFACVHAYWLFISLSRIYLLCHHPCYLAPAEACTMRLHQKALGALGAQKGIFMGRQTDGQKMGLKGVIYAMTNILYIFARPWYISNIFGIVVMLKISWKFVKICNSILREIVHFKSALNWKSCEFDITFEIAWILKYKIFLCEYFF